MALKRVDVSVLLPIVGADHSIEDIERVVLSVRAQSVPDWRLTVVDATYDDAAHALVRKIVPKDRLVWETPVLLSEASIASCLWQAAGGMKSLWAAYIDLGAEWRPDHLLRALSVGKSYELDVVLTGAPGPETEFWGNIPRRLRAANFVDPASVVHTQGIYRLCTAGWRREATVGADWDLWLQMADADAKFGHVGVPTVERRRSCFTPLRDEQAQFLRTRYAVRAMPCFTQKELEALAAEEDESAEEEIYLTRGLR